jgi:hypothetical protein
MLTNCGMGCQGLGVLVCDAEDQCYDDGTGVAVDPNVTTLNYPVPPSGGTLSPGSSIPAVGTVNTSTNTTPPLSAVAAIAAAFSSIFKTIQPLPAGCTVVAGPYGQSTQCSGTGNPTASAALSLTSALSSGGSSLLLLGGAALLIFMIAKK